MYIYANKYLNIQHRRQTRMENSPAGCQGEALKRTRLSPGLAERQYGESGTSKYLYLFKHGRGLMKGKTNNRTRRNVNPPVQSPPPHLLLLQTCLPDKAAHPSQISNHKRKVRPHPGKPDLRSSREGRPNIEVP